MKKILILTLFSLLFIPTQAQIIQKACFGTIDTVMMYDTVTREDVIDHIDTTAFLVLGQKVLYAKFKRVDNSQHIVICEGLYSNTGYIEGTNGRYFAYLSNRFPFKKLTPTEINQMK